MSEIHNHQNCREMLASLNDYIDGELDTSLCEELEKHMNGCDNCRIVVNTIKKTIELYREDCATDRLPADVRSRLLTRLELADFPRKP